MVGPKDLPRLMHMAGKWAGKARAMANEFRKSFDEMARQTELDELRKEIEELKKNNPVSDLIGNAMNDDHQSVDSRRRRRRPVAAETARRSKARSSRAAANSRSPTHARRAGRGRAAADRDQTAP